MASFFIATSPRGPSVPNYFFAVAEELARRGHAVTVAVDHRGDGAEGNPRVVAWPSYRPTRLADARFFARLCRRERYDVAVGNFGAVNVVTLVGAALGVPARVAWYHTLSSQVAADSHLPPLAGRALALRKRAVYRAATLVACNSEATRVDAERAFGVPPRKTAARPFLIPDPRPEPPPERSASRVVCVGRLDPSKGQDVLLRALPAVLAASGAAVEFVGDGPERAALERLAADLGVSRAVSFAGALPLREVHGRMASAAVSVAPSRAEALGLVSVEAQGCGAPVVASRVGGIPEVVADGETGLLVPPDDPGALAGALVRLLTDPGLRARMGAAGRRRFEDRFSLARVGEHADWFESLAPKGA